MFTEALEVILQHEGGFVNHPEDPGGMTNLGITKKTYEAWTEFEVSEEQMRQLTPADVAPIYKRMYWDRLKCDEFHPGVALALFDFGVNSGVSRAAKYLQRVVYAHHDGIIGPRTIEAVNNRDPKQIIEDLCDARLHFLESLSTWDTFGRGWARRVEETREKALEL